MNSVVVFDLDDTLYNELDYVKSGYDAVVECIVEIYGPDILNEIMPLDPMTDWISHLCDMLNLANSVKESLLWIYRLHDPKIKLSKVVFSTLEAIKTTRQIVILTDGRSVTQRKKLRALGLESFPAYISEEHGDLKPSLKRFKAIMKDFPATKYYYVGDNPQKDFYAPNFLGWISIGIIDAGNNIHHQDVEGLQKDQAPRVWVSSFEQLLGVIC